MKGKEKCRALKEIRSKIAKANDIPLAVSECTHQGSCKGTCPKCEAELRCLERELAIRRELGKAVAVVGLSLGACTALTSCSPLDSFQKQETYGDIAGYSMAPYEIETQSEAVDCPVTPDPGTGESDTPDSRSNAPFQTDELEGDISLAP